MNTAKIGHHRLAAMRELTRRQVRRDAGPLAPLGELAEPVFLRLVGDVTRHAAEQIARTLFRHPGFPQTVFDVQCEQNRIQGYDPMNSHPVPCNIFRSKR